MYDPYYEYNKSSYVIYAKLLTPERTNFTQSCVEEEPKTLRCCCSCPDLPGLYILYI